MATWHQQKSGVRLQHPTKWRLISDPPGGMMTAITFESESAAVEWQQRTGADGYILPPANARLAAPGQSTAD